MTEVIKQVVQDITGADQIVLFGSRATGDFRSDSDYDILAVVSHSLEPRERLRLSSTCRLQLAKMGIDADVLVKSPEEIRDYRDKRGSIIHEALLSGIPIEQGMDRPEHDWVADVLCFHAQQVIEKAFKAYLICLNQDPPRTHSLEMLLEAIRSASPEYPQFDLGDLTTFAVQSRYPDELFEPDAVEVKLYAELATRVLADIRHRIEVHFSD
ncbi:MAG: HEPN domain-containing protein [Spirochaetaceae bacterium]|nr:MAG: HEPN domain-containing protein [Spirochaetaceae bacterium]